MFIDMYLYACVEETERKQQLFVHGRIGRSVEFVVVQLVVGALQIGLLMRFGETTAA